MRLLPFALAASLSLPTAPLLAQTAPDAPASKKPAAKKSNKAAPKAAPGSKIAEPVVETVAAEPAPATTAAPTGDLDRLRQEKAELEKLRDTTVNLIRALVQEGVISKERALEMVPESDRAAIEEVKPRARAAEAPTEAAPTAAAPAEAAPAKPKRGETVRVPYVPETVKTEIREQLKQEVLAQAKAERWGEPGALPSWLDRISWEGDFRLRYQAEFYGPNNPPPTTYYALTGALRNNEPIANTQQDVDAWRFRFRLGMLAKVSEQFSVGARLATSVNPVSANVTLGQFSFANNLAVDRAFLRWEPSNRFNLVAGRIANPWFWPTDLIWYEDLNFEGAAATYTQRLSPTTEGFLNAGVLQVQNVLPKPETPNPRDKYLLGIQGGGEWQPDRQVRLKLGAGYFHYVNVEGYRNTVAEPNANDWSVPGFRQKGNTVFDINFGTAGAQKLALASKFHILNLSAQADLGHFDPFHVRLQFDYAKNLGFDQSEIQARTGVSVTPRTDGYQAMLTLGDEDVWGLHNWSVFVGYRYVEPDAVLDAFTQANVLVGGTNAKGYMLGVNYGLDRNVWLRWRWLSANEIVGPPLAIDVLQGDLMLRF
jgi:hypothetical protein